ncbi:sugar ABC transporter ATP-binding protein [Chelatococcus reniformis]|uniref:ABC transporter ATP-binding protein n=1 Tax=Chelatococcus reniformis TaxID=1494448 RepID=A0A916TW83_9HYPH|nr:sugar ABC transporter ATP-binding protein [Chelatococcus reniformis]GGC45867.1 ABC transporter ATP-binding protein [Chelatococcus reniformis]
MTTSGPLLPAAPGLLFEAEGLTKHYGPNPILQDVGFAVPRNKVVSFVGENGAGKSTLFNILSGIVAPDAGRMRIGGVAYQPRDYGEATRRGVARVFQEQSLILNVPVYENLLIGQEARFARLGQVLDRPAMIAAAERIIDDAGLDVDVRRRTGDYDFSKRQSIEIARACLAGIHLAAIDEPVVLLDEPTSALDRRDEEAFFRLVAKIRARGSLLFVSHRLTEVLDVSDVIYVLKDGRLVAELAPGGTSEADLHGYMVGRERAADYYYERRQRVLAPAAPVVLQARALAREGAFEPIDLAVRAGEIVGIGGLLDSGKSALGKAVAGVDPPTSGTVSLDGGPDAQPDIGRFVRQGLGYVPAERMAEGLIADASVAWNISLASGADLFSNILGVWRRRREIAIAEHYVRSLAIRSAAADVRAARLSGGNQQKAVLARWLCREPKVLVLDNPTRGVDAGAKEEIYRLVRDLADKGVAILLITDELLELIGLANRIIVLQRGRRVAEVPAPASAKPTERELVALMLPQSGRADGVPGPAVADPVDPNEPELAR